MQDAIQTITNITDGIKPIAPVLAGLVLVVIGLLWTFAKDPQKKEMYTGGMVNVAMGFGMVSLEASLVSWLGGRVVGFNYYLFDRGGLRWAKETNNFVGYFS